MTCRRGAGWRSRLGVVETDAGAIDIDIDIDDPNPDPVPPSCDPIAQNCAAPQACALPVAAEEFACITPAGNPGGQFSECLTMPMCGVGFTCVGEEAWRQCSSEFGCCQAFCNNNADCLGYGFNLQCRPLGVASHPDVGVCARW